MSLLFIHEHNSLNYKKNYKCEKANIKIIIIWNLIDL